MTEELCRAKFEEEFKRRHCNIPASSMRLMLEQYNHGTDLNPDVGYWSQVAREAWDWWHLAWQAAWNTRAEMEKSDD